VTADAAAAEPSIADRLMEAKKRAKKEFDKK